MAVVAAMKHGVRRERVGNAMRVVRSLYYEMKSSVTGWPRRGKGVGVFLPAAPRLPGKTMRQRCSGYKAVRSGGRGGKLIRCVTIQLSLGWGGTIKGSAYKRAA